MSVQKTLVIVGAGGFGREVLQYAIDAYTAGWPYRVIGFLDDGPQVLRGFEVSVPILGPTQDPAPFTESAFIVALGDPSARKIMADRIENHGGEIVTLLHPSAYVAPSARVGLGTVVCPFAFIGVNARVGRNVAVNIYGSVGHDAVVDDHCVISPYTSALGATHVGSQCMLGTHVTITPRVVVGAHSKVAAGSVVNRDCEPGSLLAGNPARGRVMFRVPE